MLFVLCSIFILAPNALAIPIRNAMQMYANRQLPPSPFLDPSLISDSVFLPESPLDAMSLLSSSKPALQAAGSFSIANNVFTDKRTAEKLKSLPHCQRNCANKLSDVLGNVVYDNNYVDKYHKICAAYKEAKVCVMKQQIRCNESGDTFDVITSGVHYMCIEQGKAFNASIGCIEQSAFTVQGFCEHQCKTRDALVNVITEPAFSQPFGGFLRAVRANSPDAISGDVFIGYEPDLYNFPDEFGTGFGLDDLEFLHPDWSKSFADFEYIAGQACHQVECGLMCMKGKFDMMCSHNAGMLLSEAFIRPLALSMQKFPPAFFVLGVALPKQCRFLSSGTKIIRHRIDPGIHAKLLRHFGTVDEEELIRLAEEDYYDTDYYEGPISPIYGDADIAALVHEYYGSGDYFDGDFEAPEEEGSGHMDLVHQLDGDFVVTSDEKPRKYRVVYRTKLSTRPAYYELTPNRTGTLRCRIFNERINFEPQEDQ